MNLRFFLLGLVSFISCFAAERDYRKDQPSGFWRQSLDIRFIRGDNNEGSSLKASCTQEDIHRELKRLTILDRLHLKNLQEQGEVKQGLGNCASCAVQLILEDGSFFLIPFNNACENNLGIKGFTTLRTSGTRKAFLSTSVDDLSTVRNWIFPEDDQQHRILSYTDTELQIIHELFVKKCLQSVLEAICKEKGVKVKAVIVHLYTEDDPCGWCSEAMVKTIDNVSREKGTVGDFITRGGRLLFEVSSTRQHLHARESGCDEEYKNGQPIMIHLNSPYSDEKSIFFSRFSAREIGQKLSIPIYRNKVKKGKHWMFEIKDGKTNILEGKKENLSGDCIVVSDSNDTLLQNLLKDTDFYIQFVVSSKLIPKTYKTIYYTGTEFNNYVNTLKAEGYIGQKLLYQFMLEPIVPEGIKGIAEEQYRYSWHNLKRLESIEKKYQNLLTCKVPVSEEETFPSPQSAVLPLIKTDELNFQIQELTIRRTNPDGDCGYEALGITREDLANYFKDNNNLLQAEIEWIITNPNEADFLNKLDGDKKQNFIDFVIKKSAKSFDENEKVLEYNLTRTENPLRNYLDLGNGRVTFTKNQDSLTEEKDNQHGLGVIIARFLNTPINVVVYEEDGTVLEIRRFEPIDKLNTVPEKNDKWLVIKYGDAHIDAAG